MATNPFSFSLKSDKKQHPDNLNILISGLTDATGFKDLKHKGERFSPFLL